MSSIPVFIDTDIGDDIDDAIALAYALSNPCFHVAGISIVGYAGEIRAGIVSALLEAVGKSAPIAIGSERVSTNAGTIHSGQIRWAARHLKPVRPQVDAAELLYSLAKEYAGRLHLVTLGPLTNIAAAFQRYPELPGMFESVHVMGGEVQVFRREHNFAADYIAASKVVEKGKNVHLSTWSVGMQLQFHSGLKDRLRRSQQPHAKLLCELIAAWGAGYDPVLFDVVPFLHLEEPRVVPSRLFRLVVETQGAYTRGVTVDVDEHATGLPLHVHLGEQPAGYPVAVSTGLSVPEAEAMLALGLDLEAVVDEPQ